MKIASVSHAADTQALRFSFRRQRDKVNLDIFWLGDKCLEDSDDLPAPDVLAQEIADELQTALEQFTAIAEKVRAS